MQRKDESFNDCRFCAPAKCTPKSAKIFTVGEVCSGGVARRVFSFGVCRLHCELALIMLDLYS